MAENSGIGGTDHTMNFWWGCHKVSTECQHCYIDDLAPVIVDRVALTIYLDGKPKGSKLSAAHMNAMLKTDELLTLRLEKGRKRFEGEGPHVRYRFMIVDQTPLPNDD